MTTTLLSGTRFGEVAFEPADVVRFERGLIGFPQLRDFVLVCTKEGSPFRWLQSIDEPKLAFLLADPNAFVEGYEPQISLTTAAELQLAEGTPRMLLTTASIPAGRPNELTLNLAGPIVLNLEAQIGGQVILEDAVYSIKHRVFLHSECSTAKQAA